MSDIEKLIFEQWKTWELELHKLAYDCQVDMCAVDSACRAVRYSTAGGLEHGHVVGGNFEPCAVGTPIQRWAVVLYARLRAAVHREVERQCAREQHTAADVLRAMTALRGSDNVVLPAGPGIRVAVGPTQELASFSAETRKPAEPTAESDVDEKTPQVAALRRADVLQLAPEPVDVLWKEDGTAHVDGVHFATLHRQVGTPNTWILGGVRLGGRFEINAPDVNGAVRTATDVIRALHMYSQRQKSWSSI